VPFTPHQKNQEKFTKYDENHKQTDPKRSVKPKKNNPQETLGFIATWKLWHHKSQKRKEQTCHLSRRGWAGAQDS
jgi:hypothetical protein